MVAFFKIRFDFVWRQNRAQGLFLGDPEVPQLLITDSLNDSGVFTVLKVIAQTMSLLHRYSSGR